MKKSFLIVTLLFWPIVGLGYQVKSRSVDTWSPDLYEDFMPISNFDWTFTVEKPSYLFVSGHVDVEHRGIAGTEKKAIMVAFQLKLNGKWLKGSKTGENIIGKWPDHYYSAQIHGFSELEPGTYTIRLYGRSASTAAPGVDGLAQIKPTYNQVVYQIRDR